MLRKLTAIAAATAFAFTALAPAPAAAQHRDHRDYRGDYYGHHDYRRGRHYRDDDHDDALAAGIVGLVLGLAVGSLASQPQQPQARCYDNYQRCAPPPQQGYYDQRYPDDSGLEGGYDPRGDGGSAYQQDYGYAPQGGYVPYAAAPQQQQCTRRERQWDRYANRYLMVDVPC